MGTRYVVVIGADEAIPERDFLIRQAWGEVPFSYFQDRESLNKSSFLDLKVNKWELNAAWSRKSEGEPWIRIEILRGKSATEHLEGQVFPWVAGVGLVLLSVEMDDGGGEIDEALLARLVSVFMPISKVLKWRDGFSEIDDEYISRFPSREVVLERLRRC